MYKSHISNAWGCIRENLHIREGQSDSTPLDNYLFTWNNKGVRGYPKFQEGLKIIEGPFIWI